MDLVLAELNNNFKRYVKACEYNTNESIEIAKSILSAINYLLNKYKNIRFIDGKYEVIK